jgi:hypothetical protein
MTIKKRISNVIDKKAIESLANELADKPYGQDYDTLARTTITLPASVLLKLEDIARDNKRKKNSLKSVSAIVRDCIAKCLHV